MMMNAEAPPLLSLEGISKSYGSLQANKDIDLDLRRGEIHALLGENGAGKSTLVGVLCGVVRPDSGRVLWQGERIELESPARSRELGISAVFQNFSLFNSLSVADNIALGLENRPRAELIREIGGIAERFGMEVDPHRPMRSMSVGEWQRVEIIRCLLGKPKLLILDEPTSVLTVQEAEALFTVLRRIAAEGCGILFISHRLKEVRSLCSGATILRQGEVVAHCDPREETPSSIAEMMIGSLPPPPQRSLRLGREGSAPALALEGINVAAETVFGTSLKDIDLRISPGTITGIVGVAGNGQRELSAVLSGERRLRGDEGRLLLGKDSIGSLSSSARRRKGMHFIPEQRLGHAVVGTMNMWRNACLTARGMKDSGITRLGSFISGKAAKRFANKVIETYKVKCQGSASMMHSLSGGNQQKFVLGRELSQSPRILVVEQPTWGVDAGSAAQIHQTLIDLAADGAAVLIISQDLDEIFILAERIAVINSGRLSEAIDVNQLDAARLGLMMADAGEAMRAAA